MIELELPGARVAFSTRKGGVSEGPYESLNLGILTDDEPERVARNRAILAERRWASTPQRVAMGWQVHGTEIAALGRPAGGRPRRLRASRERSCAKVDGHVTDLAGLGLLVLVADCLPVALAAPGRVAMLHCGWRGLAGGIVERAVELFDEPPAAAIGPGIGRCCYEVGRGGAGGVRGRRGRGARAACSTCGRWRRRRLRAAGVSRVEHVDLCTSCRADLFFSHRRDGGVTGRQGGLVWRPA